MWQEDSESGNSTDWAPLPCTEHGLQTQWWDAHYQLFRDECPAQSFQFTLIIEWPIHVRALWKSPTWMPWVFSWEMKKTDGIGDPVILPKKMPQICLFQTNLASQVYAHAIAAFLPLESHSEQVIHILCQVNMVHESNTNFVSVSNRVKLKADKGLFWCITYRQNLVMRRQNLKKSDEDSSFLSHRK